MSRLKSKKILAGLEPSERRLVMDLVAEAGINVDAWKVKKGGLAVARPAANPAYCYEWAFGSEAEPVALCVWHELLGISDDIIVYSGNMRRQASELESRAVDRYQTDKFRSRAKSQAVRARQFDVRCQDAWRLKEPVRLILLKGERSRETSLGLDASKVEFRRLDPEPWTLVSYDMDTGEFQLVRGQGNNEEQPALEPATPESERMVPVYLDQFAVETAPEKRDTLGFRWVRSAEVRSAVLARARGTCEACGSAGFRTVSGAIYLETHHVVPLSEGGPDVIWNVVAVCPGDHRIAHYGETQDAWRERMLGHLRALYPHANGSPILGME
jgi:5-methylcytosine-specific restriction protein A